MADTDLADIIARWDSGDGKPYKGRLIDWEAWQAAKEPCAMCAQGQVLHLLGGWEPERLRKVAQIEADAATVAARTKRLSQLRDEKRSYLKGLEAKLGNERYVASAPEAVVQQTRDLQAETLMLVSKLDEQLANLK